MSGHELVREIIAKHGIDRYSSSTAAFIKFIEETGELAAELLRSSNSPEVRKEYGDVGLALYGLGDKLGLDLEACMKAVVDGETRRFA